MNKLNRFLYLTIGLSLLSIVLPIIFLQIDCVKTFALKTFHTRENAYGYLQFVGSFLGVVATISATIILQEKQKYQKDKDENKKAMLNLYVQLERAFEKYKEAQRSNLGYGDFQEVSLEVDACGPRKIFIDPNYIKDLAQLRPMLKDEMYENIGLGFDAIINSYKAYLELEQELNSIKTRDFSDYSMTAALNNKSIGELRVEMIRKKNNEIVKHVDFICKLYDVKYKKVLKRLSMTI
ncbi:hypothetical protein [Clostridium sp. YIM B02569]|uniref:hypothetical protein n=1 Tax=Clostridium sp. YIM B02569 TaxID=2911967 RepID=UPI001EEB2D50|nr:hypothetical protein [Clostridium sp. YIM B02569]